MIFLVLLKIDIPERDLGRIFFNLGLIFWDVVSSNRGEAKNYKIRKTWNPRRVGNFSISRNIWISRRKKFHLIWDGNTGLIEPLLFWVGVVQATLISISHKPDSVSWRRQNSRKSALAPDILITTKISLPYHGVWISWSHILFRGFIGGYWSSNDKLRFLLLRISVLVNTK